MSRFKLARECDYDESSKHNIDKFSGLKVWESAHDLCVYLDTIDWAPISSVLEIGCGHGLPGLVALLQGKQVTFQDYDEATLTRTRETLLLNGGNLAKATFVASSWQNLLLDTKFDLILCSEAVYDTEQFQVLSEIIAASLAPGGRGLVAGKLFYFGCGGGTLGFADFLGKAGKFDVSSVKSIEDKQSNIREILQVRLL